MIQISIDILKLDKVKEVYFDSKKHLIFHYGKSLSKHPNGLRFSAFNNEGDYLANGEFYSIGGGFVIKETFTINIAATIEKEGDLYYDKTHENGNDNIVAKTTREKNVVAAVIATPTIAINTEIS